MSQLASVRVVPAPARSTREQRSSPRHACDLEAVACALDAPETLNWGATIQDLSTGGIGLSLCYPFKLGTYLAIDVPNSNQPTLLGRVIHVSDRTDGTWFIGCELIKQIDNVVELLGQG